MLITQRLRRAAQVRPRGAAVIDDRSSSTWPEVLDRVQRIANGLLQLGLQRGDRVAVLSDNCLPFYELFFAAPWAGLVMAGLNTRWSVPELCAAALDCGARVIITDHKHLDAASEIGRAVACVDAVVCCDGCTGAVDWASLLSAAPIADQSRGADEPAHLYFTGGTTGRSKGVMLTSANLYAAGLSQIHTSGLSSHSVIAVNVPMFHMSGGGLINSQVTAAATVRLLPAFEPGSCLAAIESARATHVVWVPTMLTEILRSPALAQHDLSSLERVIYGSSPMPQALLEQAMAALPDIGFTQYYGMTETSGTGVSLQPDDHLQRGEDVARVKSAGQVVPGMELRVIRADGSDAEPGEHGEICFRGPMIMKGYLGLPEATREAVRDGWMHTGDIGYLDGDGYLFVIDRLKDMIISGGENVYSSEVENALYRHPAVVECAVIGMPDEKWGEIVCAVVYAGPDRVVPEGELRSHCRSYIAGYKVPKRILSSDQPLPKSSAGKILKSEVRARWRG